MALASSFILATKQRKDLVSSNFKKQIRWTKLQAKLNQSAMRRRKKVDKSLALCPISYPGENLDSLALT